MIIHSEDCLEYREVPRKASLDRLTRSWPLTMGVGSNPVDNQWMTTHDILLVSLPHMHSSLLRYPGHQDGFFVYTEYLCYFLATRKSQMSVDGDEEGKVT